MAKIQEIKYGIKDNQEGNICDDHRFYDIGEQHLHKLRGKDSHEDDEYIQVPITARSELSKRRRYLVHSRFSRR